MTGREAIIAKITSDGKSIVNNTLEEANNRSNEILDIARNNAEIYRQQNVEESAKERDEIMRRKVTVANLEVKKLLLLTKQSIIDDAFRKATKVIKESPLYPKMLLGMLSYAEDGDVITISKSDASIFTESFLKKAVQGKKVTLNAEYGDFVGGVLLSGQGSDKNFTLEVELKTLRDLEEPEIARLLFGE